VRVIALLSFLQFRNSLRSALTQPKKLIPILIIAGFLAFQLLLTSLIPGRMLAYPKEITEWAVQNLPLLRGVIFGGLALLALAILENGFETGFLTFSLPDMDYLFTSPIHRKVVLAYRLAGKTILSFVQFGFLFYALVWQVLRPLGVVQPGDSIFVLLSLFFCIGGFVNLSFVLKLVFGFGSLALVRRGFLAAIAILIGLVIAAAWKGGLGGLEEALGVAAPHVLLYPCELATRVVTAPISGEPMFPLMLWLGLFYGITLVMLFTRPERFYEATLASSERAARLIQAMREQNWGAIFAARQGEARPRKDARPYTIPPFGRGAGALFWANLASAGKRPVVNGYAPAIAGFALPLVIYRNAPPHLVAPFVAVLAAYFLLITVAGFYYIFRASLRRMPLARLIPTAPWKLVAAEAAPPAIILSFFTVGAGAVMSCLPGPATTLVAVLLLVCAPVGISWLAVASFLIALWYPSAQDRLQQLIAGLLVVVLLGITAAYSGLFLVAPIILRAPPWTVAVVYTLPSLLGIVALLRATGRVYGRAQPNNEE